MGLVVLYVQIKCVLCYVEFMMYFQDRIFQKIRTVADGGNEETTCPIRNNRQRLIAKFSYIFLNVSTISNAIKGILSFSRQTSAPFAITRNKNRYCGNKTRAK